MKQILLISGAFIFLSSCNSPSSIAKKMLEDEITEKSKGYLKLVDFEKKDAISMKEGGVEQYSVKYNGTVECIKDGGWVSGVWGDTGSISSSECTTSDKRWFNVNLQTKAGKKYKCSGTFVIQKHEQGWVETYSNF